ncbi:ATP-binding cassette sub-family A member 2 isoform X1 [Drosophila gunungcola]|uniref:ATP-binding cassette sub-family A member 2 isoform X1 n=1 Tax=Drosophila gunungcola TaxID=103775 RepID=UPI0022E38BDD|nr:ATP-binding cassette sub-family A member 2 isoform X1 [Drosophila gunungcola]
MACSCSPLFFVFLRKNLLYLRCNFLPLLCIFTGFIGVLTGYLHWSTKPVQHRLEEFEPKNEIVLKETYFPGNELDYIYYAPTSSNVEEIVDLLRLDLGIIPERLRAYNNSFEMQLDMEQQCRESCFAINFNQVPNRGSEGKFQFSLSSNQMRISPKKRYVNDEEINHQKDDDDYIRAGFLTLQHILDKQYMKYQELDKNYEVLVSSMPNLEVTSMDSHRLIYFGTLCSILFKVVLLSTFVVPFVEEKQNGLKEFLNLVTPMSFLNGLTFFLIRFVCYIALIIYVLVVGYVFKALGLICFAYVAVLFLLYILSTMSYAYLISVCFHSVFYAKIGGLVMLIIPYVFSFVRSWATSLAFVCFSTNAFLEGLDVFQTFSNKHREFGAADLFREIKYDSYRMFSVYFVLIFQSFLYALLYNYLGCVYPGPGGLKRPILFFLDPKTYQKRQRNEYTTAPRGTHAIIITELCKKFQTSKRETLISDNLNMTINNKEITVLLGHNGAGKTTMMNMIMGLVPKDSGKIIVCSERDVASYRHLIGFCPQHSVFMSYMTCHQHLEFFAQLRGARRSDARDWAYEKLKKLGLYDERDNYGRNLSGGMKRRLSLGIAVAGNTKIVILDEPSSGLDINSRRELWDILLNLRKEKAILVTTHYMEEAEVLGDTICILANGKLQTTGAPLELKRKSGIGYRLKLEVKDFIFRENEIMEIIHDFVPTARVLNVVKPTVYICLPYSYKRCFSEMLHKLETKTNQLGINTISMTDTSLEDVFLRCAGEQDQVDTPDGSRNDAPLLTPYKRLTNQPMQPSLQQLWMAVFYKKWTFISNEWLYSLIMLCIPFVSVCCAILVMHAMSIVENEEALPLRLSQMGTGVIYIHNPTGHHAQVEQQLRQQIELSGITAKTMQLRGSNDVKNESLELQRDNLADFLEQVIGIIDMYGGGRGTADTPQIEIFYSGNRYHSSVELINLVDSAMLKLQLPQSDIETTYVPIRRFVSDISPSRLEYYAVIVSVGMFFFMFYFISLPFREYANGFRQLQTMSRFTYWLAHFVFDMLLLVFVCSLLFLLQYLIMPAELYSKVELRVIVLSIFFYGCSYLPILYALGNNFKSISTISTYLLLMLIVSAIAPLITSSNAAAMKLHETKIAFLCFLPDFNLNHQLRIINENFIARRRSAQVKNLGCEETFFAYAIAVCVLVMAFFTIVLEHKYLRRRIHDGLWNWTFQQKKSNSTGTMPSTPNSVIDDCAKEEQRVKELIQREPHNNPLIVSNLRKCYKEKVAVDGLSFAADPGECFGLLGVNGAGKTSTFQMIAANLPLDGGNIHIKGIEIRKDEVAYRQCFGYCPQYDALNKFMTAEQCLHYMAMLRGLSNTTEGPASVKENVKYWLEKMHLTKYQQVQVRHYSGGTKRKLLAAMAMIGSPTLVLLDEPTTGVDPISRRFLWQCIKDFQGEDRTVVLTSHSMDECEELCNRLAIMAHGKFKCLNNICALKRLSGFTIKLKMKEETETDENVNTITGTLKAQFAGLELRESHAGTLTYFVSTQERAVQWSDVFKIAEDYLTDRLGDLVADYSVNECTLEDIFLKYEKQAKSQSVSRQSSVQRSPVNNFV